MKIDILLPLGPGTAHQFQELRFALRSIERCAKNWRKIFIVGADPQFLNDSDRIVFIEKGEYNYPKEAKIAHKVKWAFENLEDMTDYVAFWNDDFVLTQETDVLEIPFYRGAVDLIALGSAMGHRYGKALKITGQLLQKAGREFWNYDVHLPIVFEKEAFLSLSDYWWKYSRTISCGLVMKSVYCNMHLDEAGPVTPDIKIRTGKDRRYRQKPWCFSYADAAFKNGLSQWLSREFPEKSSFEK